MRKYQKRAPARNSPDLFADWLAERELLRTDPIARRIARRFGLPIHHAATIARLAGLREQCR